MAVYSDVKEVRKMNSSEFIRDFKRLKSFVVYSHSAGYFEVMKSELWQAAKSRTIKYRLVDYIYVSKRTSMELL